MDDDPKCGVRTVVLLRHGESIWNQQERFTGWTDVDLSERGIQEAEHAGPALRERVDDILPMARRFASTFARIANRPPPQLSAAAEQALLAHEWPGNVRELRNVMERAVILFPEPVLGPEVLPHRVAACSEPTLRIGAALTLDQVERAHIEEVVVRTRSMTLPGF